MYYRDTETIPWYKDYNVWCIIAIVIIIVYGAITGQIHPECLQMVCQ